MDTLAAICALPVRFRGGNDPAARLVRESGLAENPGALTLEGVTGYLGARPALIDDWMRWSQDRRSASGWYFSREGQDFVVGHYPGGPSFRFASRLEACAEFVLREAAALAGQAEAAAIARRPVRCRDIDQQGV